MVSGLLLCLCLQAMSAPISTGSPDSLEISLLTCSPHNEVYSIYGHTAIRVSDKSQGRDFVVNYGVFDFNAPHFLWRFTFAIADYEMGILLMPQFMTEYVIRQSSVTEQVLNLTGHEKAMIFNALQENYKPENAKYRYNFFFDNCTTRARNILLNHIDGQVEYRNAEPDKTFRAYVHEFSRDYPWTTFGIDLLQGVGADRMTSRSESQFLPYHLRDDFGSAIIRSTDGTERPLVKQTSMLLKGGPVMTGSDFPLSPKAVMWLLATVILMVTAAETLWLKRVFWWFDALLLFIIGAVGIIICALFFSKHPTVSTNLQALLFNPLPLLMLVPVVRRLRKYDGHWWWGVQCILLILFLIGSFFQNYAVGLTTLALSLLIRWSIRLRLDKVFPERHQKR